MPPLRPNCQQQVQAERLVQRLGQVQVGTHQSGEDAETEKQDHDVEAGHHARVRRRGLQRYAMIVLANLPALPAPVAALRAAGARTHIT